MLYVYLRAGSRDAPILRNNEFVARSHFSQVQSGGSFDIDYEVVGPNEKVIMDGTKERQADFVFTANDVGEYRFCFNNEMSTFAEKIIDFEIAVSQSCDTRSTSPLRQQPHERAAQLLTKDTLARSRTKSRAPRSHRSRARRRSKRRCSKNRS